MYSFFPKTFYSRLVQNKILRWQINMSQNYSYCNIAFPSRDARNMAVDVRNLVLRALREKGGFSESEAVQYIKKLESLKKYSADVWS